MARRRVTPYGSGSKFDHRPMSVIKAGPNAKAVARAQAEARAIKQAEDALNGEKAMLAGLAEDAPASQRKEAEKAVAAAEKALADLTG